MAVSRAGRLGVLVIILLLKMITLIITCIDLLKEAVDTLRAILPELIEIRKTLKKSQPEADDCKPPIATSLDPHPPAVDYLMPAKAAAEFLIRSERHLYRYRAQGRLTFVKNDGQGRSGYWATQLRLLYFDLWGKWPG